MKNWFGCKFTNEFLSAKDASVIQPYMYLKFVDPREAGAL